MDKENKFQKNVYVCVSVSVREREATQTDIFLETGVPDLDLIHILYLTDGGQVVFVCHTVELFSLSKTVPSQFNSLHFLSLLSMIIIMQQNWTEGNKKNAKTINLSAIISLLVFLVLIFLPF